MEHSLITKDGVLAFELVHRKMKHIRIRVTGGKRVVVSAPYRCGERVIHAFVRDNETFIRSRLCALEAQRREHYPAFYADGNGFSFLGERALLRVVPSIKASSVFKNGVLELRVPKGACPKAQFISWMSRQARRMFAERLACLSPGFANANGLNISVKRMLTRWGSINTFRRRLSLSVHLMRCDVELIDYVIAHELCHLACLNHSPGFYHALAQHFPQRKALDKRLEAFGLVDF
jgi:hypothetical protein